MSNHELTQIFYDGLGSQDRYVFDATSGATFMSKFEDDLIELIKTTVETSHHDVAKSFKRHAIMNGPLIDAKSVEMDMLIEKINNMEEVRNFLLD